MSEGKRILEEAIAELGIKDAFLEPNYLHEARRRDRAKHDPQVISLPRVGPTMMGEGDGILGINVGEDAREPGLLIVDRGNDERPPLALYVCPSANQLRGIAAFCIAAADRLDGGAGKQ